MTHTLPRADSRPRYIVVGAGYAGVLCANRLARTSKAQVLLVTEHDTLIHRIRLHETAARGRNTVLPLAEFLNPRIDVICGSATGLDTVAHTLLVRQHDGSRAIPYDKLVLALGSGPVAPPACSAPHTLALASPRRAEAFYAALCSASAGARVVIVGGGLSAIELATEVAEAQPKLVVSLLCHTLAPQLPAGPQMALRRALNALSVHIQEGVTVSGMDSEAVYDNTGRVYPAELAVLAAGFRANVPAWLGHFATSDDGRLRVDAQLRVLGEGDVFAVGDMAAPPPSTIGRGVHSTRMGCVNAMPLAAFAADVITERAHHTFHFDYPGQNISLGRHRGLTVFTDRDDLPTGTFVDGRMGALIKELVCRMVLTTLKLEARSWFGYVWLGMHSGKAARELRLAR